MLVTYRDDNLLKIRVIRSGIMPLVVGIFLLILGVSIAGQVDIRSKDQLLSGGIIFSAFLAVGFMLIGLGLEICSATWIFNRRLDVVTYRRTPWTRTAVVDEYPLSDIIDVRIDTDAGPESDAYRIELITVRGMRIPMTPLYTSGGRRSLEKTATVIRGFLGLG